MYAYRNNNPVTPTKPTLPGIFSARLLALNAAVTSSRSGFAAVGSGLSVVSFVRPVEAEAVWAGVTFMAASSYIALSPPTPKAPGMTLAFVEESGVPQADPGSVFNLSNIISALFANVWRQLLSIFNAIFGGGISVNTFRREAELKNVTRNTNDKHVVQGFAVGTNFCYSIEVNDREDNHKLYRYDMNNGGDPILMTPGNPNPPYQGVGPLGHANDMALASYQNGFYIYVAACISSDKVNTTSLKKNAIVKLQYSGDRYWEVARHEIGNFTGIANMEPVASGGVYYAVKFLLKGGTTISEVIIPYNDSTPTLTQGKYTINLGNYPNYSSQGMYYDRDTDRMYVNYWGGSTKRHANVIHVYNNVKNATANSPPTRINSIEINKGSNASVHFELESIGFPRGREPNSLNDVFWFNTHEGRTTINGGIYTESRSIK